MEFILYLVIAAVYMAFIVAIGPALFWMAIVWFVRWMGR